MMTRTVDGVTYQSLSEVLTALGFVERERKDARCYRHAESGAFIVFPAYSRDAPAYLHHVLEARATVDGFGVMDARDFDRLLLRHSDTGNAVNVASWTVTRKSLNV